MKTRNLFLVFVCAIALVGLTTSEVYAQSDFSVLWPNNVTLATPPTPPASSQPATVSGTMSANVTAVETYLGSLQQRASQTYLMSSPYPGTEGTWPISETDTITGRYQQYKVTPNAGYYLSITNIAMRIYSSSGSALRAKVFYSTDPNFSTATQIGGTVSLAASDPGAANVTATPSVVVNDGSSFYVRVYPWFSAASSNTGKRAIIREVIVSGTAALSGPSPVIVATGTLTDFGSVNVGSTSTEQTYTVEGTNLIADLTVTAPANFEVSKTSGSGFASSIAFTPVSGTVSTSTVYVRFAPISVGVKSGNISNASTNATTQNVAVSGTGLDKPTVNTPTASAITINAATVGGTIDSDNGSAITESGVAYATTADPTTPTVTTSPLVSSGAFTVGISSLSSNTLYHYRAYAINGVGTGFSADATLTTLPDAPVSAAATDVLADSFTANWSAVSGAETVSYRLDVSTDEFFGTFVSGYENLTVAGTSQQIIGLSSVTTYYYRVRAVNVGGTSENSSTISAATIAASAPTIIDPTSASIANTTATLGANVASNGNSTLTEKGIVWSTIADPTTADNKVVEGTSALGVFTVPVTGLPVATLIHYRGYAVNAVGTSYTTDASFYTLADEPSTQAGSFSASVVSVSQIDLSWTVATGATGYIILQKTNTDPTGLPSDASSYTNGNTIGDGTVAAVIASGATTSVSITGLISGTSYHFSIIPFASDGVNGGTYNYKTDGTIPTANAFTPIVTITSNGTGGGDWNTASTWIGGVIPAATNYVVIQGTDSVALAAAGSCANLTMNAGARLALNATSVVIPGTSWNLDAASTVYYNGPTTIQAAPAYGHLVYLSATGSPNGNLTINGNLINSGTGTLRGIVTTSGKMIHNVAGDVLLPNASAKITAVNSSTADVDTCIWNIGGSVRLTGATSNNRIILYESNANHLGSAVFNINGDLEIATGSQIQFKSSSGTSVGYSEGVVNLKGNLIQNGTIGVNSVTAGTSPGLTINFVGTSPQTWSGTGALSVSGFTVTAKINNPSGVILGSPRTFNNLTVLGLVSGNLTTTATNLLTISGTGTFTGGNASSFVDGPMTYSIASTSLTSKTYPIGKGSAYRPLVLNMNQDAATATTYRAEMFNSVPPTRSLPTSLLSVSPTRYYTITKGTGAGISQTLGATVQLSYDVDDSVQSGFLARVAMDSVTIWKNMGGTGTGDVTGTVLSNAFFALSTNNFVTAKADTSTPVVVPTLSTMAMSYISTTFASTGGNISNDGGAAVIERGVCWNTTGSPTVADSKTSNGSGSGAFSSSVTGLTPGMTYYLRAYATNSVGTGYGDEKVFTTYAALVVPTVATTAISSIQVTSAVSGGTVSDWGGTAVTARGICWNTTGSPIVSGSHTSDGSDIGTYTSGLFPLVGNTTYYVRAYATNSVGTAYGNELSFTTTIPQVDTTVVVAKDGSGNYTTVQAAFTAVPTGYTGKWTIFVKNGVYYEKVTLASGKNNVILIGEDRDNTIITYDDYAEHSGGTSTCQTIAIDANDFVAKNITFENTYWPNKYGTVTGTQGVAIRTQGDRHEYYNCKFLGYQDTYYTWGGTGAGRMYHKNCIIEGSVDFIFGRNICVFDSCLIKVRRNGSVITAGATDATSLFGYVFRNCTMATIDTLGYDGVAVTSFYLGRPWQGSPRTVYINSYEPATLLPVGWTTMSTTPALYAEYNCYGPGSATGSRSTNPPSSQLTGPVAATYSLSNMFAKSSAVSGLILYDWMPSNPMSDQALQERITASAGANGSIVPGGVANVAYGSSKSYSIIPASGFSVDSVVVDNVNIGTPTSYSFTNITANHTIAAAFGIVASQDVVMSIGWNLISVPRIQVDYAADSVFKHKFGSMFGFSGGSYAEALTLELGRGYWAYYTAASTETISGVAPASITVPLSLGWNLVGSKSVAVPVASLVMDGGSSIFGDVFKYDPALGSYQTTSVINPGEAVWVYVTKDGNITLP